MSNFTSSTADKKDQKEEQSWKALLRNGSWKDLYDKAEECFISGNHLDADNACFFACLMLASLLKLGKLELARKWLNSWKEQYGLEDVPTATLFLVSPLRTQYCLLAIEVAFRLSSETDVNCRLQPYFRLRRLIEENIQIEDSRCNMWLLFLDTLDSCIVSHLLEANRLQAVLEVAKNYLKRNVQDVSRQLAFFRLLLYSGDTEQASLFWNTIEPRVKEDSERHLHRGLLYASQGHLEDAIDEWEAAALFDQSYETILTNNIAVGYLLQGRIFEAMERMEHIFHKSPIPALKEDLVKHICICYDMLLANAQERKSSIQHALSNEALDSFHFKITQRPLNHEPRKE
ncbi:uncharacterized protein Gasu_42190 [Galdieria sulphuraria]|uniref:Uncharacterized protein n=1 Tax=Galdieria sulphuraria TaxID=130081 RepID=M2XXP8_GALSU|nr:uncharacterized protein Gasu_42190 [Galdieria sulphuraria]EME28214.1 hypothetical protein Gasu_42190 [Galdieria sulphuraria]|eukprot:XP_005704734.1 hypothetical protein Gasu_42190 [Galdieria sulphuraria]